MSAPLHRPAPGEALRIAIVGAESTGKSTLATALAASLAQRTGLRCTAVPEHLRDWCNRNGRTPREDEQRGIAQTQQALMDAAAAGHDIVVADTTPLMTAVYSGHVFGDHRLDAWALGLHARNHCTLLTALDIAWQPDPLRDSPAVRQPIDARIRALLAAGGLPWQTVSGVGPDRLAAALAAVAPWLHAWGQGPGPALK